MRTIPYDCHCKRCHYEWTSKKRGGMYHYPPKCTNPGCTSPYYDKFPERYFFEGFEYERDSNKKSDGSICLKCYQDYSIELKRVGGLKPPRVSKGKSKKKIDDHSDTQEISTIDSSNTQKVVTGTDDIDIEEEIIDAIEL